MATDFKELRIWQEAFDLTLSVYKVTDIFPKTEQFALTQQIRRAAVSLPSNIAEGFRRKHNKEYKQFLFIALGSCAELETQIRLAYKLKYISLDHQRPLLDSADYLCRMINNLIKKLK